MSRQLIIEIPYGGLGDHLFHSHLPRIAKETGQYDKVYISGKSLFRHADNKKLVWDVNPHIDGFVEEDGIFCDLKLIVSQVRPGYNLLDEIMLHYKLDDGQRFHEPEVYYTPNFIDKYNLSVFDPNFLSWVGDVDKKDMMWHLAKHKMKFDAIMKIRTEKCLYVPAQNDVFIDTPTLFDFCDLIHSARQLFCLTSGTATLASALQKPATVFYGKNQEAGFRHSRLHNYILVKTYPIKSLKEYLKKWVVKPGE
jgi:hypothetical protein